MLDADAAAIEGRNLASKDAGGTRLLFCLP